MEQQRFEYLKNLVHLDYRERHDMTQLQFTISDLQWFFSKIEEQQEKISLLEEQEGLRSGELEEVTFDPIPKKVFNL